MIFTNGSGLAELCGKHGAKIWEVMLEMEAARSEREKTSILQELEESLRIMRASVQEPLKKPRETIGGLIGGEAKKMAETSVQLLDPLMHKAAAYSLAVIEENSSMGLIVAAPTAGSAGVLPGVLLALGEERGLSDETLVQGLLCAGAVGYLYMRNASISGAEAGCQAEVGVASSMAAAAVTEMLGGSAEAALSAAAIAMQNLLGLVCDPVAGLVQIPCQSRNAAGAANALVCAQMALSGIEAKIPFDETVQAMLQVGRSIPCSLRETALGGCAATPSGCAWKKKLFG